MERNINEIARSISRLTSEELDNLNIVLWDKYGYNSNIYKFPFGIGVSDENKIYNVQLSNVGFNKLVVLKRIKELLGLGLKEAKDIIDSAPCQLINGTTLINAEEIKDELEELGAVIDII